MSIRPLAEADMMPLSYIGKTQHRRAFITPEIYYKPFLGSVHPRIRRQAKIVF